jgi:hypothetical protein
MPAHPEAIVRDRMSWLDAFLWAFIAIIVIILAVIS